MPRGPACAVGSTAGALMMGERERSREEYREAGRKLMRKMDGENIWDGEREGERESRRPSVTRGVERLVTQVQSSAPACPRALLAQQRQEAAEHQRLLGRQVGWKKDPSGRTRAAGQRGEPLTEDEGTHARVALRVSRATFSQLSSHRSRSKLPVLIV